MGSRPSLGKRFISLKISETLVCKFNHSKKIDTEI